MANLVDNTGAMFDAGNCSICCKKFITPRYLPCKHSFCHSCLYSYIVHQCKSMESCFGFHCPICRVYIPKTRDTNSPEDWTKCFPENFVLEKYVHSSDQRFCEACLRESEEEDATYLCFNCNEKLCRNCTKYHNRGQSTRNHQVALLSEITCGDLVPNQMNRKFCVHHPGGHITLFCQDHEEPCCPICGSTLHRKCKRVESIEQASMSTRKQFEEESFELLLEDLEIFQNKLLDAKSDQEEIVAHMENRVDTISAETEKVIDKVIKHVLLLKKQYLTNMKIGLENSREKIRKNINSLMDAFHCASNCSKSIQESRMMENATDMTVVYHKANKCFHQLKHFNFSLMNVEIDQQNQEVFENIMSFQSFSEARFLQNAKPVKTHLEKTRLRLVSDVVLRDRIIRDGAFLSTGQFIISTENCNSTGGEFGQCFLFDKSGNYLRTINTISNPFGIFLDGWDIKIVFPSTKHLQVVTSHSFFSVNSNPIQLSEKPFSITRLLNHLYVACSDKIIKINDRGSRYATFETGPLVKHITCTSSHIIYSNRKTNEVVAMNALGTTVWRYRSPGLLSPCGLSVDGEDNIYVAGKESDNIHVLTKDGRCVRVFEDITRPDFMKVDKERKLCFVGSMRKYLMVYEML